MTYIVPDGHLVDYIVLSYTVPDGHLADFQLKSQVTVKYYNGTSWVEGVVKYYNGTSWIEAPNLKVWSGSAWVDRG